jgi:threonylcarbamoyladenosine tRNA methylthiotransferase MtaB
VFKVAFETLGCRLNQAETAVFTRQFMAKGYELVDDAADADVCVVNTCTLTHQATSKCRRVIRSIIRRNPDACVAAVGCYSQTNVEELKSIEGLDYIVGTADKMRLAEIVAEPAKLPEPAVVWQPAAREHFTVDAVGYYPSHTRANLKVQEGCSFVCSYCIIPKSRGPARSRDFDDCIREARSLALEGHREIVITGVNVGTYHDRGRSLADLVDALDAIAGVERVRMSSVEPTTIGEGIVDRMADGGKLCPYLHLPLQSGDDRVLERMRRKYTAKDYLGFVDRVRARVPGIAFGTDVIVGFPGEDEKAFESTCRVVDSLAFANVHVFSFSARRGTGADGMDGKIPGGEIARRSRTLHAVADRKKREFYAGEKGRMLRVLFEERAASGHWVGFSDHYVKVGVESAEDLSNRLGSVEIASIRPPRRGDPTPLLAVGELMSVGETARVAPMGPPARAQLASAGGVIGDRTRAVGRARAKRSAGPEADLRSAGRTRR